MKKLIKIIPIILSIFLLASCSSFTGEGEKGEGLNTETQATVTNEDPATTTPSGNAPGLYNSSTGDLKYSWPELEARGFVTVKENFITASADYLRGDLYIPNSISGIGKNAFKGCTGLINVHLGNGVTTIGDSAFSSCTGLIAVEFGNSLTNISGKAFSYCTRLPEVAVPETVTNIGASAFQGCTGLLKASVGNEVTNISKAAFSGCTGLKSVSLGKNITYIGSSAFYRCSVLSTVNYNGKYKQWDSIYIDKKNEALFAANIITTDSSITPTRPANLPTADTTKK